MEFLHYWEQINNLHFNSIATDRIRSQAGPNTFILSVKQWREETQAIGIQAKAGRYGGTYAHKDIAFDFGTWISPKFRYLLIAEFQALKSKESQEWNYSRFLSKVNYGIQTEMINRNIIPRIGKGDKPFVFASEADLLNVAVFGMTAKEFREQFPKEKGNLRDVATIQQLTVMANLESINAHLIESGASQQARFNQLAKIAAYQLEILSEDKRLEE